MKISALNLLFFRTYQDFSNFSYFYRVFKNFLEYVFQMTLIVFCFHRDKMCRFYHILLARIIFQLARIIQRRFKIFPRIFVRFQKTNFDGLLSFLLSKLLVLQLECTGPLLHFYYCSHFVCYETTIFDQKINNLKSAS